MRKEQIVRALRDPAYRATLSDEQLAGLENLGDFELADEMLVSLTGGCGFTKPSMSCVPPGTHCP